MIKLIVSDLDGTLLNSKQQISDRTLRAIKQIQRKGLRLLINTEQNYFDAKKILDTYEIPCDIACFGGSCIFDASGHQLHASYIPTKRIPEMLRIFGSCRTFYEIHSTRGLCVLGSKEGYASYICERLENAHFYDNGQLLLSENPQIIKITTQSLDQQKLEQLTNSLHTQVPHFAVSHQSPYRLDITAVNALKGAAVHFYTEKYQISLKDTMVIGDSENDYSMLGLPYIESIA
ncbi:MAG: haloacid dehalogenase, partial [Clostridiales bacterium Nov_37_41]